MELSRDTAAKKLDRKRLRQVLLSIPRYAREVSHVRSPRQLYQWFYYKLPYAFPLAAFPSRVNLEPTNDCNLACKHCPRPLSVTHRGLGYMDPELFPKIAEEIGRHPDCTVKIVGLGEPALHPHLDALMELLTRHQIIAYLYTNGELFKRFAPEQICSWNVRNLTVSIDGLDAASFAKIRVGGDYDGIKSAVAEFHRGRKILKKRGPEVEIRHVIFPNESPAGLLRFREEWLAISDTVKFNYLYYPTPPVSEVRDTKCRDIRREFYIHWNGTVPLCGYQYLTTTRETLGDMRKSSIAELWNHPRLREVREYHDRRDLDRVPFCKACTFK